MAEPIWWWSVPANRSALRDSIPCATCSCSGWYVDYVGPGVIGGALIACRACGGRGWVNRGSDRTEKL